MFSDPSKSRWPWELRPQCQKGANIGVLCDLEAYRLLLSSSSTSNDIIGCIPYCVAVILRPSGIKSDFRGRSYCFLKSWRTGYANSALGKRFPWRTPFVNSSLKGLVTHLYGPHKPTTSLPITCLHHLSHCSVYIFWWSKEIHFNFNKLIYY